MKILPKFDEFINESKVPVWAQGLMPNNNFFKATKSQIKKALSERFRNADKEVINTLTTYYSKFAAKFKNSYNPEGDTLEGDWNGIINNKLVSVNMKSGRAAWMFDVKIEGLPNKVFSFAMDSRRIKESGDDALKYLADNTKAKDAIK